jgi:hypothetical protein
VQACANDPLVAFHAVHVFSRIASSAASLRWAQLGFGRTSSTSHAQVTPRNLMGFKDGTDNIRAEDTTDMNSYVWVQPADNPMWMTGGTYLIARRIKILFDVWDSTTLEDQQRTIGRDKLTGAPLGSNSEFDPVELSATATDGELLIPANAHIRLASPHNNRGERILRRGYSYSEPVEPGSGQIDAGLFFIAFQRSPERQFVPFNAVWPPATRSTITPSTRRAPCSPVHPEYHRVGLLAMFCLPNCDLQTPRAWRRFVPREPPGLGARGYHVRAHSWPGGRQASLSRKRRGLGGRFPCPVGHEMRVRGPNPQ